MIRTLAATLAVALLLPARALAQNEFEGLDLTDDPTKKKPDEPKPSDKSEPASTAPGDTGAKGDAVKAEPASYGERDITQEDRVKSVQRKLYLKRHRLELAPYVLTTLNDPYYAKFGVALRLAYYLSDTLAISLRGNFFSLQATDDVKIAKRDFSAKIFYSTPFWSAMADAEWSPIYGKVSFMNSILHFDAYLIGGAGVVNSDTSSIAGVGPHPAADLGLGARFVAKDFLAVNLALINTSFVDQPLGTSKGAIQNIQAIYVGISLFFPFKSTFREAE